MANRKQPYNWNRVKPGDIISFRYKTKSTGKVLTHSLLVLNPKITVTLKDGTIFQEEGSDGDATDWKWAVHQGFYDKNWLSIDEEEINET